MNYFIIRVLLEPTTSYLMKKIGLTFVFSFGFGIFVCLLLLYFSSYF